MRNVSDPCIDERRALRVLACADTHVPVKAVDGDVYPILLGEAHHYTTPAGDPVRYPMAYQRAFGRPVYHQSTIRVEVGRDWLVAWRRQGGCYSPQGAADRLVCLSTVLTLQGALDAALSGSIGACVDGVKAWAEEHLPGLMHATVAECMDAATGDRYATAVIRRLAYRLA